MSVKPRDIVILFVHEWFYISRCTICYLERCTHCIIDVCASNYFIKTHCLYVNLPSRSHVSRKYLVYNNTSRVVYFCKHYIKHSPYVTHLTFVIPRYTYTWVVRDTSAVYIYIRTKRIHVLL